MAINLDFKPFLVNIYNYTKDLLDNTYMPSVTTGIIASEKTNSIIRTLQYALGWMELHNSSNQPLFEFYSTYRENILYTLLGIIPFLLSIPVILFKKTKTNLYLLGVLILFVIVASGLGMSIIEKIPYLSSSLRWASSKLWPMYVIPIALLPSIVLAELLKGRKLIFKFSILLPLFAALCFYGYPVLSGKLLSTKLLVNIPSEYFTLPNDSKILVLPHAQRLYMRDYDWGYYGSDFLSYINRSQFVDGADMYEYATEYESILETGTIPDDIKYVVYDASAEMNLDSTLKEESQNLVKDLTVISSNKYFTLYER